MLKTRIGMSISILAVVGGLFVWTYSLSLPAYQDEVFYQSKYQEIGEELSDDSIARFRELRSTQLTSKYRLQDFSLTALLLGLIGCGFSLTGLQRARAPSSSWTVAALGLTAAVATSLASVVDLYVISARGELPWWSDSLAIPMYQEVLFLAGSIGWVALHLLFLRSHRTGQLIFSRSLFRSNPWLVLLSILAVLVLVWLVVSGQFLMIVPCLLWIYFYLSLASGRSVDQSFT